MITTKIRILSGDIMWISKEKYERLNRMAEDNEHDASLYRRLVECVKEKKTVLSADFVIMSNDIWNEIYNKYSLEEDKYKNLEAELEWYKVKYHEMK